MESEMKICDLCEREVKSTTFHHLIPVKNHNNKWFKKRFEKEYMKTNGIDVCKQCHKTIHKFWDEKTLGKEFNTIEKLLESEKIQKHIQWVQKLKYNKKK